MATRSGPHNNRGEYVSDLFCQKYPGPWIIRLFRFVIKSSAQITVRRRCRAHYFATLTVKQTLLSLLYRQVMLRTELWVYDRKLNKYTSFHTWHPFSINNFIKQQLYGSVRRLIECWITNTFSPILGFFGMLPLHVRRTFLHYVRVMSSQICLSVCLRVCDAVPPYSHSWTFRQYCCTV